MVMSTDEALRSSGHVSHGHDRPRLGHLLKHAYLDYLDLITTALVPLGITPSEWAALNHFTDQRPLSQVEAARLLGMDRTTMVSLVDGLESKQLVNRRTHAEDRRKNIIELTTAGHEMKKRALRKVEACERQFLGVLAGPEAEQLQEMLRALLNE